MIHVLILCRVFAENNILQRARAIKREFKRFHLVVVSGSRTWLSFNNERDFTYRSGPTGPTNETDEAPTYQDLAKWVGKTMGHAENETKSRPSISDILTAIVKKKGLDDPIAVIGYSNDMT